MRPERGNMESLKNQTLLKWTLIAVAVVAFGACGSGPSKEEARKAIADSFNNPLAKYRTSSERITIHDLKGAGESVDLTALGLGESAAKAGKAGAVGKGSYVAVATFTTMLPMGAHHMEADTVGAVFGLFPSGKEWRALPLSEIRVIKKAN